jgi:DNA repair exonuclease SbcCD ATPase subunit
LGKDDITDIKGYLGDVTASFNNLFPQGNKKDSADAETQAHLLNNLSSLNTKLDSLERVISVGVPLSQANDNIQKLDNLQRGLDSLDSKLNLYISTSKELKEKTEELSKMLSTKVNRAQIESLSEKIDGLEKMYSELSVSKTNESLVSLIEILETLRGRIKKMEGEVEKEVLSTTTGTTATTPASAIKVDYPEVGFRTPDAFSSSRMNNNENEYTKAMKGDEKPKNIFKDIISAISSLFTGGKND